MQTKVMETALSDEALVRRCQEELPQITTSFEILVARHMQRVYGVVYKPKTSRKRYS